FLSLPWVLLCMPLHAQQAPMSFSRPAEMLPGNLVIAPSFTVRFDGRTNQKAEDAKTRFLATLANITGIRKWAEGKQAAGLVVRIDEEGSVVPVLGEDESYDLHITPQGALLHAHTTDGALHGLQTFLQSVRPGAGGFVVSAANIQDRPRFPWRGLMLDC